MFEENSKLKEKIELCQLLVDRGDLLIAAEKLEAVSTEAINAKDFNNYLKSNNILIRVYAELDNKDRISEIKDKLQELIIKEGIELTSKTHYLLGISCVYKNQVEQGLENFEKALKLALSADDKVDICYALYGLAAVYWKQEKYDSALKELYNLDVFFQVVSVPQLQVSSLMLNGYILNMTGKQERALEIFWQAYSKLKEDKNFYNYLKLMYAMGTTYLLMGDKSMARVYLELALKSIDPKNLSRLYSQIVGKVAELGDNNEPRFDLMVNLENNQVVEKTKGKVDFKSQFVLLDLLKLFVQKPGEVYSKEELVKFVWKQDYNPAVHDNKVYVTIKRLRKLIEPDYDRPKYIFRAKNGYFINKNMNISLGKH